MCALAVMRPICVMPVMMVHTMQAALSLWFYHYDDDDHDDHHGHKKTHDKKNMMIMITLKMLMKIIPCWDSDWSDI